MPMPMPVPLVVASVPFMDDDSWWTVNHAKRTGVRVVLAGTVFAGLVAALSVTPRRMRLPALTVLGVAVFAFPEFFDPVDVWLRRVLVNL